MFAEAMGTSMCRNLQLPAEDAREPAKFTTKFLRNTGNAVAATDQAGPADRTPGELPAAPPISYLFSGIAVIIGECCEALLKQ